VVKYLLLEVARLVEADRQGRTLWSFLDLQGADHAELTALLPAMVLLGDAPSDFIAKLSPLHVELCTRSRKLRSQLPAYCEQQNAAVTTHCPLPSVLRPIVAAYRTRRQRRRTCGRMGCVSLSSNAQIQLATARGSCAARRASRRGTVDSSQCQRAHWTAHKGRLQATAC
jgi:hypothetical protein